jgi:hypothetical protein
MMENTNTSSISKGYINGRIFRRFMESVGLGGYEAEKYIFFS